MTFVVLQVLLVRVPQWRRLTSHRVIQRCLHASCCCCYDASSQYW